MLYHSMSVPLRLMSSPKTSLILGSQEAAATDILTIFVAFKKNQQFSSNTFIKSLLLMRVAPRLWR